MQEVDTSTFMEESHLNNRFEMISTSISSMYHDIQKIERMEMAKHGLKGPHAQCLFAMNSNPGGVTASQLCELCEKDKAAISRTVAELEQAGLVRRINRNGSRYRALLVLTEKGVEIAQNVNEKVQLAVMLAGEGLEDAQREVFYPVLTRIAGNLHTICKEGLKAKQAGKEEKA